MTARNLACFLVFMFPILGADAQDEKTLVLSNTINTKRVKELRNGTYAVAWLYDRTKVTGNINSVNNAGFKLSAYPVQFDQLKVLKVNRKKRKLGYVFLPAGVLLFTGGLYLFSPGMNLVGLGLAISGTIMVTRKSYATKKWKISVK